MIIIQRSFRLQSDAEKKILSEGGVYLPQYSIRGRKSTDCAAEYYRMPDGSITMAKYRPHKYDWVIVPNYPESQLQ